MVPILMDLLLILVQMIVIFVNFGLKLRWLYGMLRYALQFTLIDVGIVIFTSNFIFTPVKYTLF
jgi:hypothetical protein